MDLVIVKNFIIMLLFMHSCKNRFIFLMDESVNIFCMNSVFALVLTPLIYLSHLLQFDQHLASCGNLLKIVSNSILAQYLHKLVCIIVICDVLILFIHFLGWMWQCKVCRLELFSRYCCYNISGKLMGISGEVFGIHVHT